MRLAAVAAIILAWVFIIAAVRAEGRAYRARLEMKRIAERESDAAASAVDVAKTLMGLAFAGLLLSPLIGILLQGGGE